jgi:hypothetical protein
MRKVKALRWSLWFFCSTGNEPDADADRPIGIDPTRSGEPKMHTLSLNYPFDAEDQKADLPWLPTTFVAYSVVVACTLAFVAAMGAGNAAELMGAAIVLAAP